MDFKEIALRMLTPPEEKPHKNLNPSLFSYLNDIDVMCRHAGGTLLSRQAIAVAIKQWQNEHKAEQPLVN